MTWENFTTDSPRVSNYACESCPGFWIYVGSLSQLVDAALKAIEGFLVPEELRASAETHAEPLLKSPGLIPTVVIAVPEDKKNKPPTKCAARRRLVISLQRGWLHFYGLIGEGNKQTFHRGPVARHHTFFYLTRHEPENIRSSLSTGLAPLARALSPRGVCQHAAGHKIRSHRWEQALQ